MDLVDALPNVPDHVRTELVQAYSDAADAFRRGDCRGATDHIGVICENAIRAVEASNGRVQSKVEVERWCTSIQNGKQDMPEGGSVELVRTIWAAYAFRNHRAAHSGITPKRMDAAFMLATARWIVGELVRHQSGLTAEEAQTIADELSNGDAEATFSRILGHRYSRYYQADALEWPEYLADRDSLDAMASVSGVQLLSDKKLGYLFCSAIHQDFLIDFWHSQVTNSVGVATPLALLATFEREGWNSARRARAEMAKFPAAIRDEANRIANAEIFTIDHPETATIEQAETLLLQLQVLRNKIEQEDRKSRTVWNLLGDRATRRLIGHLKTLLSVTGDSMEDSVLTKRGSYLDPDMAGFIFSLCVYLNHRDTELWRKVCSQSEESAMHLGDIVLRPGGASRLRAAAELALYSEMLRKRATIEVNRSDKELAEHIRKGWVATHAFIMKQHPEPDLERWVGERYEQVQKWLHEHNEFTSKSDR